MLLLLVVCLGVAIGQEVTDEVIDNINEATGLALKDSFRCGLFFPDPADKSPDKSALPYLNLYIFNATFDAKSECDAGSPNVKRYNDFCAEVWDKGGKGLVLTSPSLNKKRGADGVTIGDDICNWVKTEGKTPFVGKNSKKFPNGLEFGMYSNSCGNKLWDWAGRIHHEIVNKLFLPPLSSSSSTSLTIYCQLEILTHSKNR